MFRKFMFMFCALALVVVSAAPVYHVTISNRTWVGTTELMPGDYNVQIQGDKAVMKMGKETVEVPAKVETMPSKYPVTSLHTNSVGGKNTLEEIWVGGTTTKIVLK